MRQNPRASDHRVRATLKTFKKNYHEEALGVAAGCRDIHGNIIGRGYGMNLNDRIKLLAEENVKQRSSLKEKTYELEALTSKYRKIQSMVQSGQFLQALSTSAGASEQAGALGGGAQLGAQPSKPSLRAKPAAAAEAARQQPATGAGAGQPLTTVLLTSRPATAARARASISAPRVDELDAERDAIAPKPVQPANNNLFRSSPAGGGGGPSPGQQQRLHQLQQQQPAVATAASQLQQRNSPPLMSSVTQLASTTNTSSTNNATDLTTDFSSSRLISTATTSSGLARESASELGERVHEISRQVAAAASARHDASEGPKAKFVGGPLLEAAGMQQSSQHRRRQQGATAACATAAGRPLQNSGPLRSDEDLFTILSCINNRTQDEGRPAEAAVGQTIRREHQLDRWLEGPFCTVMLRQTSLDDWQRQRQQAPAACLGPLAGRKQASQQSELGRQAAPTKQMLMQTVRQRIPRTLSMIEYLGLNEFDLIARRHERILRHKRQLVRSSCCASCSCCLNNSAANFNYSSLGRTRRQQMASGMRGTSQTQLWSASAKDLSAVMSSSDPINSEDLMGQSSSLISCSTCCSLASPTYGSHSDTFDDGAGGSDQSSKGGRAASSSSQTISSSLSHSSSIVIGGERHRHQHAHHQHLQHHRQPPPPPGQLVQHRQSHDHQHQHQHHSHHLHHHHQRRPSGANHARSLSVSQSSSSLSLSRSSLTADFSNNPNKDLTCAHHHIHRARQEQQLPPRGQSGTLTKGQPVGCQTAAEMAQHNPNESQSKLMHERSLCTAGILYGPPSSREGANESARVLGPGPSTSSGLGLTSGASSNAAEDLGVVNDDRTISDGGAPEDAPTDKITIKCDVLENL